MSELEDIITAVGSLAALYGTYVFIAVMAGAVEGTWTVKVVPPWKRNGNGTGPKTAELEHARKDASS